MHGNNSVQNVTCDMTATVIGLRAPRDSTPHTLFLPKEESCVYKQAAVKVANDDSTPRGK